MDSVKLKNIIGDKSSISCGEERTNLRTILISEADYYDLDCGICVTYDMGLYNKLHDEKVKVGETLRLLVEERDLYCDMFVEDIEYGDGTIWLKYIGDNE